MGPVIFAIVLIVLIIGSILIYIALTEPHLLEFNRYVLNASDAPLGDEFIPDKDAKIPVERKPPEEYLNILFFSDLHAEFCFIEPVEVINIIRKTNPDAVIFGGDICNKAKGVGKGIAYLNRISDACKEIGIPFLGVTGNHDVHLEAGDIAKCGFEILNGSYRIIKGVAISGVTDSGRHERVWPDLVTVPSDVSSHVLIVHNPDYVLNLPENHGGVPVKYVLSGHIHGGQIRTPFKIEFTVLRKDILPKRGVHQGVHKGHGLSLFISRGLGCILMPFRLCAKPEISLISIPVKEA